LQDGITAEAELEKASKDVQAGRVEEGVLPGESPPEPKPNKPPKGKKK
jgi:hypothetical protein